MEVLQIVVPMAGHGSRFSAAGFREPKPLIDVAGRVMIDRVVENLTPTRPHRFFFVAQGQHCREHDLERRLSDFSSGCAVVPIEGVTEGAACTVLRTEHLLEPDQPLMIANCDQWVDTDIDDYLAHLDAVDVDGLIMTMPADDPKWSYVRLDANGHVTDVVEKRVVSPHATVGIYNFRRAGDFLRGAHAMINDQERVNGEFYVAPVYNRLVSSGARILPVDVGEAMWGLGTPEDLEAFLARRLLVAVAQPG